MMQLPQHHKPSKPSAPSCCSSWIRRSPPPSPPHKKPGGGGRSRYACRLVPLLVLTVYSVVTVLRIPSSSLVVTTADSERVERREDLEALKTHLPSNQNSLEAREETRSVASLPCSAFINGEAGYGEEGVLCCDRSHYRSDVCYLRGDVRTDPSTSSVLLYNAPRGSSPEKVRPYTRKFEGSIMSTIDEVTILPVSGADGLIPLFITAQRFAGEVVFVVLEYHYWWLGRYGAVLERLTNYKVVDFRYDRRVHCFDEMIVGLRIHGELVVDPKLMPNGSRNTARACVNRDGVELTKDSVGAHPVSGAAPRAPKPGWAPCPPLAVPEPIGARKGAGGGLGMAIRCRHWSIRWYQGGGQLGRTAARTDDAGADGLLVLLLADLTVPGGVADRSVAR
ncbi:uncharacterized protein C2845_PM05G24380 [Panicum miliaceum]|uniref:Uncharacterized protein n=1 Tax=Panicum miliaceum TaxID=4540 RepID=A0A3L6SUN9_PANMI|nr:uncharacterized protein C2845_PM05G24380 [Panicum miliaceum]